MKCEQPASFFASNELASSVGQHQSLEPDQRVWQEFFEQVQGAWAVEGPVRIDLKELMQRKISPKRLQSLLQLAVRRRVQAIANAHTIKPEGKSGMEESMKRLVTFFLHKSRTERRIFAVTVTIDHLLFKAKLQDSWTLSQAIAGYGKAKLAEDIVADWKPQEDLLVVVQCHLDKAIKQHAGRKIAPRNPRGQSPSKIALAMQKSKKKIRKEKIKTTQLL